MYTQISCSTYISFLLPFENWDRLELVLFLSALPHLNSELLASLHVSEGDTVLVANWEVIKSKECTCM